MWGPGECRYQGSYAIDSLDLHIFAHLLPHLRNNIQLSNGPQKSCSCQFNNGGVPPLSDSSTPRHCYMIPGGQSSKDNSDFDHNLAEEVVSPTSYSNYGCADIINNRKIFTLFMTSFRSQRPCTTACTAPLLLLRRHGSKRASQSSP